MNFRDLAIGVAYAAHAGQHDRDGRPHIDHVGRVVANLRGSHPVLATPTAWLHDVCEDSAVTPELLVAVGFPSAVVGAVRLLTRDTSEGTYMEYVTAVCEAEGAAGHIARCVKRADLEDNIARCEREGNSSLLRRYTRAYALVCGAMHAWGEA